MQEGIHYLIYTSVAAVFTSKMFRFKVEIEPYPTICRIVEELEKNESFKAAHPSNQPDCPENPKNTS